MDPILIQTSLDRPELDRLNWSGLVRYSLSNSVWSGLEYYKTEVISLVQLQAKRSGQPDHVHPYFQRMK